MDSELSVELDKAIVPDKPAKRCSDYDSECKAVKDHFKCWRGGLSLAGGKVFETDPADGYCPFVLGLEKP